ncbi:MAG TPA: bifunctional methylenetetrahydrofolate dehydrogenase/methenyltetrahydrofolate cyclohydrolase FolD [Clostridiaceae bacterium]|nr:bifunctional methylenetetrahydrofolate dehydrogenase/methenyltetrahydrofolate cyclohydrolase FolD [Clostridiaceae bacterium]
MALIIDGKALSRKVRARIGEEVKELNAVQERAPGLAVIQLGEDPASTIYVNSKIKACTEAGIESFGYILKSDTSEEELLTLIAELNSDPRVDGILCQLPLPDQINEEKIILAIDPDKDVDGFHPFNVGLLSMGKQEALVACTPLGCIEMLKEYKIPLRGKKAVVIGRSNIVGKPMAYLLLRENCTVTITHSHTPVAELPELCRQADILVVAIGKPGFITPEYTNPDQVIIDVGINRTREGKIIGDVDFESVAPIVHAITPVPGGVGPMTIAMLLKNTVTSYRRRVAD